MNYKQAFSNLANAFKKIEPTDIGHAPDSAPRSVVIQPLTVSEKLTIGTVANRPSNQVLDKKDHFPVITQSQAQSSMARVLQLTDVPVWYSGTIAELRQEVYNGIVALHPKMELNVRVPIEQTVALSDGQTPSETSMTSIKNPNDVTKSEVPAVKRPTLTSAQMIDALKNEDVRKAVAGRIMEVIEQQSESIKVAKKLATRLLDSGLTGEEVDQLSTYLQEDIMRELIGRGVTASTSENRRLELLNRLNSK